MEEVKTKILCADQLNPGLRMQQATSCSSGWSIMTNLVTCSWQLYRMHLVHCDTNKLRFSFFIWEGGHCTLKTDGLFNGI